METEISLGRASGFDGGGQRLEEAGESSVRVANDLKMVVGVKIIGL